MSRWLVDNNTGCWVWQGSYFDSGYGRLHHGKSGKSERAHIIVYEEIIGEVPKNKILHHKCENKFCVNPYHCEPLTHKQHSEKHPYSDAVKEIMSQKRRQRSTKESTKDKLK